MLRPTLILAFILSTTIAIDDESIENPNEITENDNVNLQQERQLKEATTEKNKVQEWFENLGKDTQKSMDNFQNWLKESMQKNTNAAGPEAYMGSFQVMRMPMPQIGDIVKGMSDFNQFFQGLNKLNQKN